MCSRSNTGPILEERLSPGRRRARAGAEKLQPKLQRLGGKLSGGVNGGARAGSPFDVAQGEPWGRALCGAGAPPGPAPPGGGGGRGGGVRREGWRGEPWGRAGCGAPSPPAPLPLAGEGGRLRPAASSGAATQTGPAFRRWGVCLSSGRSRGGGCGGPRGGLRRQMCRHGRALTRG